MIKFVGMQVTSRCDVHILLGHIEEESCKDSLFLDK